MKKLTNNDLMQDKINEIIDYINKTEKGKADALKILDAVRHF